MNYKNEKKLKFIIYLAILSFLCFINISLCTKMLMRTNRNMPKTCRTENTCEECWEDGYFKTCKDGVCYCCNMDQRCKSQEDS